MEKNQVKNKNKRNQSTANNMQRQSCNEISIYLLVALAIVATATIATATASAEELEVHNTFKPEVCERKSKPTDLITLHYKGSLKDSEQVFDSSYERAEPFTFQLGIGQVILGWDKGLLNVCAGEKLRLIVPPSLGYGDIKHEQIPPSSTLVFDVEVLKIEDGPKPVNVFKEIDSDGDQKLTRKEVAAYLQKQLAQSNPHGDMGSAEDPNQAHIVDEIFMHEDKDKDNYITHEEFSGPKHDHDEL